MSLRNADLALAGTALAGSLSRLVAVSETVPPGSAFAHPRLSSLTIIATEAGGAECLCDGQPWQHRSGTLALLAPGIDLRERCGDAPWSVRYLMLSGPLAEALARLVREAEAPAFLYQPASTAMRRQLAEAVDLAVDRRTGWDFALLARLAALAEGFATQPAPLGEGGGFLDLARRLIDRAPDRSWTTAELARSLGLRPRTLNARFTLQTGLPPARWVLRRRLEHARALLERGLPVQDCAERLGFANPFHFSRAFSRAFGVPPSRVGAAVRGLHG